MRPETTTGFGAAARDALNARVDFLVEQGLAYRQGARTVLTRNLLSTLRDREVSRVAEAIRRQTGVAYRPAAEGTRVSGVYGRSVMLASGRFAILSDGLGFSLLPWKPVIEPALGQTISAVIRNGQVNWYLGRERGIER